MMLGTDRLLCPQGGGGFYPPPPPPEKKLHMKILSPAFAIQFHLIVVSIFLKTRVKDQGDSSGRLLERRI